MFTIVGGGSVGLGTLSLLLEQGSECKLYEATDRIGGILRDIKSQDAYYFSGCQYLTKSSLWFNSLSRKDLLEFNQSFASFTDLFGPKSISREFSGPVYDGILQPLDMKINLQNSIHDKIMGYQPSVREGLLNWLTMLGVNPRDFHAASLKPLGISRIHFRSHDEKIYSWRKEEPSLAEYFGIPFANHGSELPAIIPRFGFSRYFDEHFYTKFKESIIKNSSVQIKFHSGTFKLKSNKSPEIESRKILWSGNPNPILRALGAESLDSFNFTCQLICGEVRNWDGDPLYVQVFSRQSKVLRVYLYKLNGVSRFTIERAYGSESIKSSCDFAEEILSMLDLQVTLEPRGVWKQSRFNLFTLRDYKSIADLDHFIQDSNLISGAWLEYSRDSKISKIVTKYFS